MTACFAIPGIKGGNRDESGSRRYRKMQAGVQKQDAEAYAGTRRVSRYVRRSATFQGR